MKNTPSLNRTNAQKAEMQLFFPSWVGGKPRDTAERTLLRLRIIYVSLPSSSVSLSKSSLPPQHWCARNSLLGTRPHGVLTSIFNICFLTLTVHATFCSHQRCKGQEMGAGGWISLVKENSCYMTFPWTTKNTRRTFKLGLVPASTPKFTAISS